MKCSNCGTTESDSWWFMDKSPDLRRGKYKYGEYCNKCYQEITKKIEKRGK